MALHASGDISVDVPSRVAFTFLQDPHRLAGCIPGCRDLREIGPNCYTAMLSSRVAFVTLGFKVTIEVVRIDPPHEIEAAITGDAVGLAGHVAATATVRLTPEGEHQTRVRYMTDVALTGKLGGLGEPVFRSTSAQLAREFGANLKRALEAQPTGTVA